MQDSDLIKKLGGASTLAKSLTAIAPVPVNSKQAQAWSIRNRIPGEWRHWVARIAADQLPGFSVEAFILSATPRKRTPTKQVTA